MGKKKYTKQVYFGFDADGKQIRKRFYGDTKAELNENILKYQMEIRTVFNPSDVTFGEYADEWIKTYKSNIGRSTQNHYLYGLDKCRELYPCKLKQITRTMCQKVVNENWEHPHAAKTIIDTLRQIFNTAIKDGMIAINPAADLARPKMKEPKFHLLTEAELEAVANADLNPSDRLFVTILQVFGLRPGEALALMPKDFDFKKKVLHITKSLELPKSGPGQLKTTKTGVSRDIPIPEYLIPALRRQIRAISGFLLFEKGNGGLHTKTSYRNMSDRIWKAVNIALGGDEYHNLVSGFRMYDFRHKRATDLYYLTQQGMLSTKKAAELMGHSEIMFLKRYSHIDEEQEHLDAIYSNMRPVNL